MDLPLERSGVERRSDVTEAARRIEPDLHLRFFTYDAFGRRVAKRVEADGDVGATRFELQTSNDRGRWMKMSKYNKYKWTSVDDDLVSSVESRDAFDETWMNPARLSACLSRAVAILQEELPGRGAPERAFIDQCLAQVRNTTELLSMLEGLERATREAVLERSVTTWALDRRVLVSLLENQVLLDAIQPRELWLGEALFMRGSFLMRRSAERLGELSIEDIVPCRLADWRTARPILGAAFDQSFLTEESVQRLRALFPDDRHFAAR